LDLQPIQERAVLADDLRDYFVYDPPTAGPERELLDHDHRGGDPLLPEHVDRLPHPIQAGHRVQDLLPLLQVGQDVSVSAFCWFNVFIRIEID
jgi:hypothetical protein